MIDFAKVTGLVDLQGAIAAPIAIKNRKFAPDAPLTIRNGSAPSLNITGCENIIIEDMHFGDQGTGDVRALSNRVAQISTSRAITFQRNDVARGTIGLLLTAVTDSLVDANLFHELNEDGIRPLDCERLTIRRNEFTDWRVNTGKHPDAVQPWNPHLGRDADGLQIIDNCAHRGDGDHFQGFSVRYQDPMAKNSKGWSSYINLEVSGNLCIGLSIPGITVSGQGFAYDNEVLSFPDVSSRIFVTGSAIDLQYNSAEKYVTSAPVPASNKLTPGVTATEETALVAAWRARVFPVVVPDPVPVSPFTAEEMAWLDARYARA